MLKKYIAMLCIIASLNIQGSAWSGLSRLGQQSAAAARSAYNRGLNQVSNIGSYLRGYTPNTPSWITSNIGVFKRPISNMTAFAPRSSWARPVVMTGLAAGAGLGTGYCLKQNPVFAQESNNYWESLQYALPKKMQERIDELVHGLNTSCGGRNNYLCTLGILNGFDELIGLLLGERNAKISTGLKNEDINFRGDRKQLAQDLLPQILAYRKQAVDKRIESERKLIQLKWKGPYYNSNDGYLNSMLTDIGEYSGAVFKYDLYPTQDTDWVTIPPVYQDVITSIRNNPSIKQAVLDDLANTKHILQDRSLEDEFEKVLFKIANVVEAMIAK